MPSFLIFAVDELLEMLAEQVDAPLPLDLDCEGVDQLHDIPLTHLSLSLRPVLLLFALSGLGDT